MVNIELEHYTFSKIPIFAGLFSDTLHKLESISNLSKYKKKDIIALQGDEIQNLCIVKKGMVNLFFTNNNYEEIFYTSLSKNDPLGVFEIFFDQSYAYSAKALTDCEIIEIPKHMFLQIVDSCHKLQLNINYEIAELLKRSYDIIRQSNSKVERKVLNLLVFFAEEFGSIRSNIVEIKGIPNQTEIALMVGTTRETISRILSALQKDNIIIFERSTIVIPDFENFKRFSEKYN